MKIETYIHGHMWSAVSSPYPAKQTHFLGTTIPGSLTGELAKVFIGMTGKRVLVTIEEIVEENPLSLTEEG